MRRYLLAALMVGAIVAALGYTQIGGDDAGNDSGNGGGSVGGRVGLVPDASHDAAPGPPWDVPVATPAPESKDGPKPGPPEPGADAAAASPDEAGAGEPERGEPQPQPAAGLEDDVVSIIHEVFGVNAGAALAVAWCESRFDPNEVGDDRERGLFQIHPTHWSWLEPDLLFDARYNAEMAFELSRGGTNWSSWSCQP